MRRRRALLLSLLFLTAATVAAAAPSVEGERRSNPQVAPAPPAAAVGSAERMVTGSVRPRRARLPQGDWPLQFGEAAVAGSPKLQSFAIAPDSVRLTIASDRDAIDVVYTLGEETGPADGTFAVSPAGAAPSTLARGSEGERALVTLLDRWVQENASAERQVRRASDERLAGNETAHQLLSWLVEILDARGE